MNANPNIIEVTQQNAQQVLIDESYKRAVLVDFWADWCEPCKNLMPVLEKLADEYAGKFLLAKVNADELQPIAQQLQVRSLPTVIVMLDGQPVDMFTGAQPENEVRVFIDKHVPAAWQGLIEEANQLMGEGNFAAALPLLQQAYQESNQESAVAIGVAQVYLHLNRLDDAEALLKTIPMADQDAFYEQTLAQLELKREASHSPELQALEQQHKDNPEDLAVAHALAVQYSQSGKPRDALELLLAILKKDLNFEEGAVKKAYLDIIAALGKTDPLAAEFQRKIYTLLY